MPLLPFRGYLHCMWIQFFLHMILDGLSAYILWQWVFWNTVSFTHLTIFVNLSPPGWYWTWNIRQRLRPLLLQIMAIPGRPLCLWNSATQDQTRVAAVTGTRGAPSYHSVGTPMYKFVLLNLYFVSCSIWHPVDYKQASKWTTRFPSLGLVPSLRELTAALHMDQTRRTYVSAVSWDRTKIYLPIWCMQFGSSVTPDIYFL
jgi:hypothetical protein